VGVDVTAIASVRDDPDGRWPVGIIVLALVIAVLIAGITHLHRVDTAGDAPPGTSLGWGGPLEPGQTWLYVEATPGGTFEVDGRRFVGPNRVPVSARQGHDVRLAAGGSVRVRWIPCTTAVVSSPSDHGEPVVDRFYNSSTCY
jgi:hypothetical protein